MNGTLLLKDGVQYLPYEYTSEEELAEMVIEHYREIFSDSAIFFDPQTMKTQMGIEARNDGIVLVPEQNKWYILEVELSKHPLHEHIIPQISRFSIAYDDPLTRKKIVKQLYDAIHLDPYKQAALREQGIEETYRMLTNLIDIQPIIAIVIDDKTTELEHICRKLPFQTETSEFKTYARENVGIIVHIHQFQPLWRKIKVELQPAKDNFEREQVGIPRKVQEVLEVAQLIFKGEELPKAVKNVAQKHGINYQTVADKMTRQLGIDMSTFRDLVKDKRHFIEFLATKYAQYQDTIRETLA